MATKTDILKKAMLKALEKTHGIVTEASKKAKIHRSTHYDWINNDPEYKKAVDDIENMALDFTESKMFEGIQEGDKTLIIFHLKTKGKKRGYTERNEIEVVKDEIDLSDISDEDLHKFKAQYLDENNGENDEKTKD